MKISPLLAVVIGFSIATGGCATTVGDFTKKFVRTSKKPKIFRRTGAAQDDWGQMDIAQRYRMHFTLWRNGVRELSEQLEQQQGMMGGLSNRKAELLAANESLLHLESMHKSLNGAKQADLEPYVTRLTAIVKKVQGGRATVGEMSLMRRDLESDKRRIERRFDPQEVKSWLIEQKTLYLDQSPSKGVYRTRKGILINLDDYKVDETDS